MVCGLSILTWSLYDLLWSFNTSHDHVSGCVTSSGTLWSVIKDIMPEVSFLALLVGSNMSTFLPFVIM